MTSGDDEGATPSSQRAAWRFLVDENLNPDIATELATLDIRAEHLLDVLFEGADDFEDILPYCRETETILVTNNVRDFNATNLATEDHAGIVIVHDKDRPPAQIAAEVERITDVQGESPGLESWDESDRFLLLCPIPLFGIPFRNGRDTEVAVRTQEPAIVAGGRTGTAQNAGHSRMRLEWTCEPSRRGLAPVCGGGNPTTSVVGGCQ